MTIYFGLLFIILSISFIKSKKIQTLFIFVVLFTVLSLRKNTIGTDLLAYIDVFQFVSKINIFNYNMEKGYLILNRGIRFFSTDERVFIIVISFITTFFITMYIKKRSKIIWLSFFLFVTLGYYFMSFHIFRQFLAMGIMLSSINYIEERNLKKFLLLYFLAISFHYTAAVFILLYIVYPIKINKKLILSYSVMIIFSLIFSKKILRILFYFIPKYDNRYADNMKSGEGIFLFVLFILIVILGLIFGKNRNQKRIEYHMMFLSIFLQAISITFSLFVRVVYFFSISMIIFIPNILYEQRDKKIKYLGIILVIIGNFFFVYNTLKGSDDIVPYLFYWN